MTVELLDGEPPGTNKHLKRLLEGDFTPNGIRLGPVDETTIRIIIDGFEFRDPGPLATVVDTSKLRDNTPHVIPPYGFVLIPPGEDAEIQFGSIESDPLILIEGRSSGHLIVSPCMTEIDPIRDELLITELDELNQHNLNASTDPLQITTALFQRGVIKPTQLGVVSPLYKILVSPNDLNKPPWDYIPYQQSRPHLTPIPSALFGNATPYSAYLRPITYDFMQ